MKSDKPQYTAQSNSNLNRGMVLGALGVLIFSITLPATRVAVQDLHPIFVSMGRAIVAAILAAAVMLYLRTPLPTRAQILPLLLVALGVVLGFPALTSWAMRHTDASHGGVVLGVLPLATAVAGAIFSKERPKFAFWCVAVLGSALVVGFALFTGGGALNWADLALFAAVLSAATGYALGAKLSQSMGGLAVISWALVLACPFVILPAYVYAPQDLQAISAVKPIAWLAFAYVSIFSQYLGFLPWYQGLALGGTARVGQVQLLQPFCTLFFSAVLLGENLSAATLVFAVLVFVVVGVGRKLAQ